MVTILLFIDCSKMAEIRINTSSHTKEKPYMMTSQFSQNWEGKNGQYGEQRTCLYVSEICGKGIFVSFPWWLKNVKSRLKITPPFFFFQMGAILKFDFQKRKQFHFSEENYLNYTKKTKFCLMTITFSLSKGKQEQAADPFGSP